MSKNSLDDYFHKKNRERYENENSENTNTKKRKVNSSIGKRTWFF